jgi:hypothetical protein
MDADHTFLSLFDYTTQHRLEHLASLHLAGCKESSSRLVLMLSEILHSAVASYPESLATLKSSKAFESQSQLTEFRTGVRGAEKEKAGHTRT